MTKSKIKDENFYQVTGWMLNRLKLKGISLEVYAIIYGFSQDEESEFRGSISYLCDFTGTSRPTIIKALKELVAIDYIVKIETEVNGVKFNKYKANLRVVKELNRGSKETLQVVKELNRGSKETLQGGSKETLPNNKKKDNKDNKDNKERKKTSYDSIIDSKISDEELKKLIYGFIQMRNLKKKPLTDLALERRIDELFKLSNDLEEQKKIVGNSIDSCWDKFYGLKKETNDGTKPTKRYGGEYAFLG